MAMDVNSVERALKEMARAGLVIRSTTTISVNVYFPVRLLLLVVVVLNSKAGGDSDLRCQQGRKRSGVDEAPMVSWLTD